VRYSSPIEIWYGYQKEAEKRQNRPLEINQINHYWRKQALDYIASNPAQTLDNMLRKLRIFTSHHEVSFNKSLAKDELFSPVLNLLPRPFGWLFALGLPGMIFLGWKTPRSWPMLAAVGATIATFMVFVAAARFRFHALPLFAVGSGVFIAAIIEWRPHISIRTVLALLFAVSLGGVSIWSGMHTRETPIDWTTIAWGYLKMGQTENAVAYATKELKRNPNNPATHELLGYVAFSTKQYDRAIGHYRRSLDLSYSRHVIHYNLGLSLEKTGQIIPAMESVSRAVNLNPLPEYLYKQGQLLEATGSPDQALVSYQRLLQQPLQSDNRSGYSAKANERIKQLIILKKNGE